VVEDSGDRFTLKLISAVSPRGDMRFSVCSLDISRRLSRVKS
jgi:hypothetical protein